MLKNKQTHNYTNKQTNNILSTYGETLTNNETNIFISPSTLHFTKKYLERNKFANEFGKSDK